MNTQRHTIGTKTAIGYVRVSTQEQATDGVSLDAQRDKLRAYCKVNGIKLIDIKADEGYSGSTLDRLGARLLSGSYYGQTVQIWAALFAAALVAAVLVMGVGVIERRTLRRMGMAR